MTKIVPELQKEHEISKVVSLTTRSDKMSWDRKKRNLDKIYDTLQPIEDEIHKLEIEKEKIIDKMMKLRNTMVVECIHPKDYLVHKDDHIVCRFCEKKLGRPNV